MSNILGKQYICPSFVSLRDQDNAQLIPNGKPQKENIDMSVVMMTGIEDKG